MKTPAPETLRSGGGGRNDSSLPVTASDQPHSSTSLAGPSCRPPKLLTKNKTLRKQF